MNRPRDVVVEQGVLKFFVYIQYSQIGELAAVPITGMREPVVPLLDSLAITTLHVRSERLRCHGFHQPSMSSPHCCEWTDKSPATGRGSGDRRTVAATGTVL